MNFLNYRKQKMKISYVGNRTSLASDGLSFNTENHIALSLEKLNHEVNFIQENTILPGTLVDRVRDSNLFLWTRTWNDYVTKEDLRQIEALGIPTVSFHLDKYSNIARSGGMGMGSAFWDTQYIFSPEGSVQAQRIFKEHGINQRYLPAGVFEDECYVAEPLDELKCDITFVGGGYEYGHPEWSWYRKQLLDFLTSTYGNRFVKYGWPQETIRGKRLNQLYASAKLVIGDSLCKDFMDSYYFSDRQFEVTGRAGCLINPYIAGITDYFVDRKEIILYSFGNWTQLKNLIDYYLANDSEREAIRLAGHERTKSSHTYTHRMQSLLSTLRQEGAIK